MALLYRAIWDDDLSDACAVGTKAFGEWCHRKDRSLSIPDDGIGRSERGGLDVSVARVVKGSVEAVRFALHEEKVVERWTTTLTVIERQGSSASFWVDLEFVAADAFRLPPEIEPPRLVASIIELGNRPRRGPVQISAVHRNWLAKSTQQLLDLVLDESRDLPIVVFTPDPNGGLRLAEERADSAARTLAGIASVEVLSSLSVDDFNDGLGKGLGVWGGAVRVYLPGAGPDDSPYRHFFLTASAMSGDIRDAGRIINRRISLASSARRAPDGYDSVRSELAARSGSDALGEVEALYIRADDEAQRLRHELSQEQDLRFAAAADLEAASQQLTDAIRYSERLERVLSIAQVAPDAWDSAATEETPDADSCANAADLARRLLGHVRLPASATSTTLELDAMPESRAWGRAAWRGLQALDRYARDAAKAAGFWDWCESAENPLWPASSRKLAMSESDSVINDRDLRDRRIFPVSSDVDPAGRVLMLAHLKIAEGGGAMSPRIYFYDDTKGATGLIHVGFFGPHRHVPNKSAD